MPTNRIKVDPIKLDAEIDALNKAMESYLSFWQTVNNGLGAMMNGMDPVLQRNIGGKMDSAMRATSACSQTLMAMTKALRNCKETYQSVDDYLAKEYANWLPEEIRNQYSSSSETKPSNAVGNGEKTDSSHLTSEYDQKIQEMKNTEGFRQGDPWGWNDKVDGFETADGYVAWTAWSCCAKAKQMQCFATGRLGGNTGIADASQIKPGDVIHYYCPGTYVWEGNEYQNEHWVYVISVDGGKLSIGEGNYNNQVNYRELNLSDFHNSYPPNSGYCMESIWR